MRFLAWKPFFKKLFPKLVGARDLTREVLDEWHNYFHQCSECRRCSVFCPYGIDTAEVIRKYDELARQINEEEELLENNGLNRNENSFLRLLEESAKSEVVNNW